ncbi:MAG: Sec-independent protein translocase protein TatB [Pseudomonadales bacterium]|jgi:sec-independent protein translocase protein TatB|nr:Sec-independent protein translocase protein TatB [Pseudomonadales bacterium]
MFDIGFSELLIVAVVMLLVVGPERLPETVKTAAVWLRRAREMLSDAKETIKDEIGMDEISQDIHNENVLKELKQTQQKINQSLNSARSFEAETLDQLKQTISTPDTTETASDSEQLIKQKPNTPVADSDH